MGYLSGFVRGAALGAALGVIAAPQAGEQTLRQLRRLVGGAKRGAVEARGDVPWDADPQVARAWDGAASVLGKAEDALDDGGPATTAPPRA